MVRARVLVWMDENSPKRGAAAVNNELEVGYDAPFETRWRHIELASHVGMTVVVAAALVGLFGRGPLSHRTHQSNDGRLAVDYEPIARYGTTSQITLHLSSDGAVDGIEGAPKSGAARVVLNSELVEPMGLQQIIPQPVRSEAVAGGVAFVFSVPAGKERAAVRFVIKPAEVGPVRLNVSQGNSHLAWTQFVSP
jgi:hypothetical protein